MGRFLFVIYTATLSKSALIAVAALASIVVMAFINTLSPLFLGYLVDEINRNRGFNGVIGIVMTYAALRAAATALGSASYFSVVLLAQRMRTSLKIEYIQRLAAMAPADIRGWSSAQLQLALDRGERACEAMLQASCTSIIPSILQITIGVFLIGNRLGAGISAVVLAYGAMLLILTWLSNRSSSSLLVAAVDDSERVIHHFNNLVQTLDVLRLGRSISWALDGYKCNVERVQISWSKWAAYRFRFAVGLTVTLSTQIVVTLYMLIPLYNAGQITLGDIVFSNALIAQLMAPFEMIGGAVDVFWRNIAEMGPLLKYWSSHPECVGADLIDVKTTFVTVEVKNLRILRLGGISELSFRASKGFITFLVGPSGAGKSTVLRLLLGEREPYDGHVSIGGVELRGLSSLSLRRVVGYVPQDIVLLNDTVRNNIVLGRPFSAERLDLVLAITNLKGMVDALPAGLDTDVGERGTLLSGGERQRVAIARALYDRPRLLLLDEPSSSLDEDTEFRIFAELRKIANHTTIVAVTHRQSIISDEDNLVELNPASAISTNNLEVTP